MKAEDCKIGMMVIPQGDRFSKCKVIALPDALDKVRVSWGNEEAIYSLKDLQAIDPKKDQKLAKKIQKQFDKATSAFEEAFKALEEATRLGNEAGMDDYAFRDEGLVDVKPLETVIEQNGWSSSSLWC